MARGPYQGSFQPNLRPTVVTAPDALVYFNGKLAVSGCPGCSRTFDVNKYITSITVDLNIDSSPGSASINLAVPRHTIDDFYFDSNPIISPMMEVEIYAKGYYLLEGIPQYYPIFWGLVTEVNDSYSGGAHTVSINCADILKWWELCKMNINPALTAPGGKSPSFFQNAFSGMNPFDIIFSLAEQAFGDVIVGTGSLVSTYREQNQATSFDAALADLCLYWQNRFSKIRNGLLLYGTNGVAVRGDTLESTFQRIKGPNGLAPAGWVANAVRNGNGGPDQGQMSYDPTSPSVVAFRNNYSNLGVNFWQSEFQTKLELATAAKESIGYEFFMDVDGSIVFKPPFYNLDVLSNKPQSWIQDIDIIDWDFSESEAEVITQVIMQGSYAGTIDFGVGQELTPFTSVTDYHLLRKYGWRSQTYNSEFLAEPEIMFYQGLDLLDRLNARRHRGTVNIPLRPELRLGFPVYVAPKDQIWYVNGLSHSIQFGGRAQTTVTLTAKRTKFIGIQGITTLTLQNMNAAPPPATASPGTSASGPGNSNSSGDPQPSTAFPYSSRQLSAQANFTLNLGTHPAFLPAINTTDSASGAVGINPYKAVILQHPTTGRILGAPNVVMVYTGSFASAATYGTDYNTNTGQHNPGQNPATQKTQQSKVSNTQQTTYANRQAVNIDDTANALREKHIVNRYTYGLTSAGRFVYAYDSSSGPGATGSSMGVIGEILTLPVSHVTVTPTPQDSNSLFKAGTSALIRPVSDERGFEVVGHFKYGRRVSLRDGSLVLTGNTNRAANVDMQLSLGGNLYDTLTAQSQGLTAISSAYPNPANAVAKLQPSDLQTAAVIQPDVTASTPDTSSGNQLLGPSGYNAIGQPQQAGSPPSVEATQLSRALTLAEMDVPQQGQDPGDPNDVACPCMLARSDLAFLNTGYTISGQQITGTASPDFTTLGNSVLGAPVTATLGTDSNPSPLQQSLNNQIQIGQNLQTQLDAVQARADQIDQVTNPVGWAAAQQTIQQLQNEIDAAMNVQDDIETQIANNQTAPNQGTDGSTYAPPKGSVLAKAEQFLVKLYQALDGPHQQQEHVLRGDYLPGGALAQPANYLNDGATSAPPLAPPFSPATSSALGNPAAIALAADSAVQNIGASWSQFGAQLQSSAQRTKLTQQIAAAMAQLSSIQGQISALQQQASKQGTSVVVSTGQTAAQEIAALNAQAAAVQQQISTLQTQLAQLPQPLTGGGGSPTLTTVTG